MDDQLTCNEHLVENLMDKNMLHFDQELDVYTHKRVSHQYSTIDNVALLDIEENMLVLDIDIIHDPRSKTDLSNKGTIPCMSRILVQYLDKHFHLIYICMYILCDFPFERVGEVRWVEVDHRHIQI